MNEENEARKALNRLLTAPLPPKVSDGEEVSDEETFNDLDSGDAEMEPDTDEPEV